MIAPVRHNQIWRPHLLKDLADTPILLPPIPDIVTSPMGQNHPLATRPSSASCMASFRRSIHAGGLSE